MLERVLHALSLVLARLGGAILLATAVLVSIEVVLRRSGIAVLNLGTELSSYALAVGGTFAFAYVVFERGHVRVDAVTQRLPGWPRACFDVLAMTGLALVGVVLAMGAFGTFMTSLRLGAVSNTTLATPLALPQGLWMFGLGWFTLVAVYRTFGALRALLGSDLTEVSRIAAPASVDVEAEEVARDAVRRMEKAAR